MHCQKGIVSKIADIEADYVIGLKGNQGNLFDDVKLYFEKENVQALVEGPEKGHGRLVFHPQISQTIVG